MDRLQQGRNCNSSTRQEEIYSYKSLSPLEAIKGEPGLETRFRLTHALPPISFTEQRPTLCPPQSRDQRLSPLSQPACTPLLQAPLGARQYRPPISLDVGHSRLKPV